MNSVLITGGTGSFGQALTRELLNDNHFDRIVIYSRDEHKQEKMNADFCGNERLRFFIGDVRDKERLALAAYDCLWVVHAAALKIVPTGEYNPMEFKKTNIDGACNLVEVVLNRMHTYGRVIALSTDKAVAPINLYGATKLCMEKIILASNVLAGYRDIKFNVVRYGNVANSNGSVIPKFRRYWLRNEPLPITSELMTRFWIELPEAAKFVADALCKNHAGRVLIPPMPTFKITDLAKAFYNGSENYKIVGIREGEKLHEQIAEGVSSDNPNIPRLTWQELKERLLTLGVITE